MININSTINAETQVFDKPRPFFAMHKPDFERFDQLPRDFENLVVIGNGGSVTSFRAISEAFRDEHDKNVEIITTMDPDYLQHIERNLEGKTVVMPISKSGTTTGVIESTLYFLNRGYEVIPLTSGGALKEIAERKDLEIVEPPSIGGRFSGLSATALAPAAMLGLHVREIFRGGRKMHEELVPGKPNKASKLASMLYRAEEKGFTDVLTPFYATRLFGFYPLLVQLMHESICKKGKGQTFYGDQGPEYQHHTNQRLFGGRENVLPVFIEGTHEHATVKMPPELRSIELRGRKLAALEGESYEGALKAESSGVKKALMKEGRPFIEIKLEEFNYASVGGLIAFMQYLAVYSAWIRGVNAFDQPDVEKSKQMGFERRFSR